MRGNSHLFCIKCAHDFSVSRIDLKKFKDKEWVCPLCRTVIIDRLYSPVNKKDGIAVFAAPRALGDWIVIDPVIRFYKLQNPLEKVVLLPRDVTPTEGFNHYKPDKFFMHELCEGSCLFSSQNIYTIRAMNEVKLLARYGFYPQLPYPLDPVEFPIPREYAVLHLRNIDKRKNQREDRPNVRNVLPELAKIVCHELRKYYKTIYVIGNDKPIDAPGCEDLRNTLTLGQISYIIKHANIYVGRDSGPAHIAAAVNTRIAGWDYAEGSNWYPKMPADRYDVINLEEHSTENILKVIRRGIKKAKGRG